MGYNYKLADRYLLDDVSPITPIIHWNSIPVFLGGNVRMCQQSLLGARDRFSDIFRTRNHAKTGTCERDCSGA